MEEFVQAKENGVTQPKEVSWQQSQNYKIEWINSESYNGRFRNKMCRDPGFFRTQVMEFSVRIWTRDLQIFSLTLSQLSYLGSDASIQNNAK